MYVSKKWLSSIDDAEKCDMFPVFFSVSMSNQLFRAIIRLIHSAYVSNKVMFSITL